MSLLPQDPKVQAKIAVAITALAGLAYYYAYPYTAAGDALAERETRVEHVEAANAKARRAAAAGVKPAELAREAARSRATLDLLRRLVPTEHEVPALLEQVSTAARRAGLEIGGVAPEPMLPGAEFDTYRYKVTVVGGYHPLTTFLANVGSLPRIVAPVTFELVPRPDAAARGTGRARGTTLLSAAVTVQTYVAHAAPGHAAPARVTTTAAGGEVVP
ncbi:MAG TPA: type 4a pilus biogenesis protein PilO [Gemmatirosa sp.]